MCWGANGYNQCGVSDSSNQLGPVTVTGQNQYDEVVTGLNHTCGRDGIAINCWGNNDQYQRTAIATGSSLPPTSIVPPMGESMPAWTKMAAGTHHTCAISSEGVLYCWGASRWGQVGAGAASEASAAKVLDGMP
jgi:alpha-tubulin suppressor-like RCC1 family protein